ncbi:MAG TPA: TolC family protein, partial [Burkholderiales bacterium]|nr:TolC family protein [Burkholderiales bacterium]
MKLSYMKLFTSIALLAFLTACAVGPDYVRPDVETPAAFKELEGWKQAEPKDLNARGEWWSIYNDPTLNELAEQVSLSNQNLIEAEARFRQAQALVRSTRSEFFPTISGDVSETRSRSSSSSASSRGQTTNRSLSLNASWELDVWGRIRRAVEADEASAQASAADLQAARLSIQAELAQNYFRIRALDTQKQLFDQTVTAFERSLQ